MKKLLLVITIAVFSCIFAKGQGITVKLSTLTAKLNDTITCSVNVDNFNNIIAFGVDFTYNNSVLTFLKFTNFAMGGMNYNNVSEQPLNRILIGWNTLDVNGISLGNTKIIDVQFIYKGGETDLLINTGNTMFMDKNTDILSYNIVNGKVSSKSGYSLSGVLTYNNALLTTLNDCKIILTNSSGVKIDSTITDINGSYKFYNLPNGTYNLTTSTNKTAGGWNPMNALLINRYYIGAYYFTESQKKAGDVNKSGNINPVDALIVNRRYVELLSSFKSGDWMFYTEPIIVSSADVVYNYSAYCYGDVSGVFNSNINYTGSDAIISSASITAKAGDLITIPITVKNFNNVACIGFKIQFDKNVLKDSSFTIANVNSNITGFLSNLKNNTMYFAWHSGTATGISISEGKLFDIKIKYLGGSTALTFQPEIILGSNDYKYLSVNSVNGTVSGGQVPVITQQPANKTKCIRDSVLFKVIATGATAYKWQKNGNDITGATNSNFIISSVLSADEGIYRCLISNTYGTVSSNEATLTVKSEPVLNIIPITITKNIGESLNLTVSPSGSAPFLYQWFKNQVEISAATNNSFDILHIKANDAGSYSCKVKNDCGELTKTLANLTVNVANAATLSLSSVQAVQGQEIIIPVTAKNINMLGALGIAVQYDVNVLDYVSTDNLNGIFGSSISINNVSGKTLYAWVNYAGTTINLPDATLFTIKYLYKGGTSNINFGLETEVTDVVGENIETVLNNGKVTPANHKIFIVEHPLSSIKCENDSMIFKANAESNYILSYKWMKNDNIIEGATNKELKLYNLKASDAGKYKCRISNDSLSLLTNEAVLTMNVLPTAKTTPEGNFIICEGSELLVSSVFTGAGLTYQWYRNDLIIQGASVSTYNIKDAGSYSLKVSNTNCFAISNKIIVDTKKLPEITTVTNAARCGEGSVTLKAIPSSGNVNWYISSNLNTPVATGNEFKTPIINQNTIYLVEAIDGDCKSLLKKDVIASINPLPDSTFIYDGSTQLCEGQSLSLKAVYNQSYSYQWQLNNNNIEGATLSTYSATVSGFYSISVSNTNNCKTVSSPLHFNFYSLPVINLPKDTTITNKQYLSIDVGAGFKSYLWSNGSVQSNIIIDGSQLQEGSYTYRVTVTNENNCSASDEIIVTIIKINKATVELSIPSAKYCKNDTISLPLNVKDFINAGSLGLFIEYDSLKLEFIEINNINNQMEGVFSNAKQGVLTIAWSSASLPVTIESGVLFYLKFYYKGADAEINISDKSEINDFDSFEEFDLIINNALITENINSSIEGIVSYENTANTLLTDVKVLLFDFSGKKIDSTITNASGFYKFSNLSCGKYIIKAESKLKPPTGTISPVDALIVNRVYTGLYKLDKQLKKIAGDVNLKNGISPIDALYINRYYLGMIKDFPAGKWHFETKNIDLESDKKVVNIKGICIGDINTSFKY